VREVLPSAGGSRIEGVGIGMPVKAVFRRICEDGEDGAIHYAFKFVRE
jgi:uncharacterized OB-fold protein